MGKDERKAACAPKSYFDEIKFCRSYDALTSGLFDISKYDGRTIEH